MKYIVLSFLLLLAICQAQPLSGKCANALSRFTKIPDASKILALNFTPHTLVYSQRPLPGVECLTFVNNTFYPAMDMVYATYTFYNGTDRDAQTYGYKFYKSGKNSSSSPADDVLMFYDKPSNEPGKTTIGLPELTELRSTVLYLGVSCVLMQSRRLGYNLWLRTEYLRKYKDIPEHCQNTYSACAGPVLAEFDFNCTQIVPPQKRSFDVNTGWAN